MKNQVVAILMFVLVICTIVGFVLKTEIYWFVLDYLIIAVCSISGVVLLIGNKNGK